MTSLRRRAGTLTGGVLVGALSLVAAPAVAAGWTDSASVTGTTITAATVPAPTLSCGLLGLGSVTFNWTAVPGATLYALTFVDSTGTASSTVTTTNLTSSAGSSALIAAGTATVRAQITYAGGATWVSVASNVRNYSLTAGLLGICS